MLEASLRQRLIALFNRPQSYLIYLGGEGGEFLVDRISQYSPLYGHGGNMMGVEYRPDNNRTLVTYPSLWAYITCTLPYDVGSIDNVIAVLDSAGMVTDERLTECEAYFDLCGHPLFRMHRVNSELFDQHPCHFIISMGLWREYARALAITKADGPLDDFINYFQLRWNKDVNDSDTVREIREYMTLNGIERTSYLRFRACYLRKQQTPPDTVSDVFALSHRELRDKYWFQVWQGVGNSDAILFARHSGKYGGHLLDLSRIISEPQYLAGKFNIENHEEFYARIRQWHQDNLVVLRLHGFTEFDSLSLD
jgi:hypothetical protein